MTRRVTKKANKWGKAYLNKGLHEYFVSPKHAGLMVNIILSSGIVIIQDENYRDCPSQTSLWERQAAKYELAPLS